MELRYLLLNIGFFISLLFVMIIKSFIEHKQKEEIEEIETEPKYILEHPTYEEKKRRRRHKLRRLIEHDEKIIQILRDGGVR